MKGLKRAQLLYTIGVVLCASLFLFWTQQGFWASLLCLLLLGFEFKNRHKNIRQSFVHVFWFFVTSCAFCLLFLVDVISPGETLTQHLLFFGGLYFWVVLLTLSFSRAPLLLWPKSQPNLHQKIQMFLNVNDTGGKKCHFTVLSPQHCLMPYHHSQRHTDTILLSYIEKENTWHRWPEEWYKTKNITYQKQPISAHQKMHASKQLTT